MKTLALISIALACWACPCHAGELETLETYIKDYATQKIQHAAETNKKSKNIEMMKRQLERNQYDVIAASDIYAFIAFTAMLKDEADNDSKGLKDPTKFKEFLDATKADKKDHIAKLARYIELKYSANKAMDDTAK